MIAGRLHYARPRLHYARRAYRFRQLFYFRSRSQVTARRRRTRRTTKSAASSRLPPSIDRRTIESSRKRRMAGTLRPLPFFGVLYVSRRSEVAPNAGAEARRLRTADAPSVRALRGVPSRAWRFLASRTEGSTDCATLRRRERSSAPGVAPVANEMWLQPRRRCRRSGEMWSHLTPTGPAKPVSATGRQRTADAILTSMIAMGTEPWSTNMRRPVRR